jgi:hypothetical protein
MVKNTFISALENLKKGQLPSLDMDEWNKIKEEYPCFAGAFMLEAIDLKSNSESDFEAVLPIVALRVPNRAILYDRVHEDYSKSPNTSAQPKVPETTNIVEQEGQSKEPNTELKSLVDEIRKKRTSVPKPEKKTKDKRKNVEAEVNKNLRKNKSSKNPVKPKVTEPAEKKPDSFTAWLKNKKPVQDISHEIPIDPVASHEAALYMEAKKSSHQLEDFLVNAIQKKQKLKQKSVPVSSFAISETYAKILAQQGKIDEAIKVYKELSIKYPKKSSSFARQIEKLKSN